MPLATLVRAALPPILPRMMSCRGPHMFLEIPMISTVTGSGSAPWNTVHAVPFMPFLSLLRGRLSTLPDFGHKIADSATEKVKDAAVPTVSEAGLIVMEFET